MKFLMAHQRASEKADFDGYLQQARSMIGELLRDYEARSGGRNARAACCTLARVIC